VDLNSDGHFDILSGSYSRQDADMAGLFQVLWGQPGGTFKKAAILNGTDGQPLIIPVKGKAGEGEDWIKNICTRPYAVDWDGDGHLDLVVGNFFGTFYLFKGEGKGKFAPVPEEMKAGDQPLKIEGHHSDPFVIDWDRDGDLDLLSGSSVGGVAWSENRAGPGKVPQLAAFQSLIKGAGHVENGKVVREEDLKGPASATRVWADDVNGDGKLDLLVGDMTTLISPAPDLTEQQFKEKFDEWNQSVSKASAEMNATDKDEKARNEAIQKLQKLYSQRSQFMKEDSTGFVWLYLQK
jgi:uncharacterized protein YeaO (DUF488 family)